MVCLGVGEGVVGELDGLPEQGEFGFVLLGADLFDDLIGLDEGGSLAGGEFGVDVAELLVGGDGDVVGFEAEPSASERFGEVAPPVLDFALHLDDLEVGRFLGGLVEVAEVGGEPGRRVVSGDQQPAVGAGEAGGVAAIVGEW